MSKDVQDAIAKREKAKADARAPKKAKAEKPEPKTGEAAPA